MNNNSQLTDQDYKVIAGLIKQSRLIANLYQELYELELAGLKSSDDYALKIDYLTMAIDIEKRTYDELTLDQYRLFAKDLAHGMPLALAKEQLSDYFRELDRIMSKLIIRTYFHPEFDHDIEATVVDRLFFALEVERTNNFLIDLEAEQSHQQYLPELIKKKYEVAFVTGPLEQELLSTSFTMEKFPTIDASLTANMLGIDNETLHSMRQDVAIEKMWTSAGRILAIEDEQYKQDETKAEVTILRSLMKSGLLCMDLDSLREQKALMQERFTKSNNLRIIISQSMVMELINKQIMELSGPILKRNDK